jgi:hypothetical protein
MKLPLFLLEDSETLLGPESLIHRFAPRIAVVGNSVGASGLSRPLDFIPCAASLHNELTGEV